MASNQQQGSDDSVLSVKLKEIEARNVDYETANRQLAADNLKSQKLLSDMRQQASILESHATALETQLVEAERDKQAWGRGMSSL